MAGLTRMHKRLIIRLMVFVVLFAIAFIAMLNLFSAENAGKSQVFAANDAQYPDHVITDAKLMSIDPLKGDMTFRLQFMPEGNLVGADGISLTRELALNINNASGSSEYRFKKGDRMNPIEVVISMEGEAGDYPFDNHAAVLYMDLSTMPESPPEVTGAEPEELEAAQVPMVVRYTGGLKGYSIVASEFPDNLAAMIVDSESEVEMPEQLVDVSGVVMLVFEISRSTSVQAYSIFVMSLLWFLALGALSVTIACVWGSRETKVEMFAYMAALLFALPPLREAMPSVPPIGVLSDYLSFFWAEAIVALCLTVLIWDWLRDKARLDK